MTPTQEQDTATPRERDGYPPGVPCWIDTSQPDPAAAARFYGELFGWDCVDQLPAEAPGHYFIATLDGAVVAGIGSLGEGAPTWNTYVAVRSADEAAAAAWSSGGSSTTWPSARASR